MLNQERSQIPVHCEKGGQQDLPGMAALFIEELAQEPEDKQICAVRPNFLSTARTLRQGKVLKLLATGEIAASISLADETILSIGDGESSGIETALNDKLRLFICGISNCFNDIVMGIWGNISLIHMNRNAPESVRKGIRQIEQLIQHGSVLIHIVFGYLAESRTEAKQIRLNQLQQQLNEASLSNDNILDSGTIESFMRWASSLRNPACLSRSIARVIEKLLQWMAKQHQLVMSQAAADDAIRTRLMKIDASIRRGFALTEQLRQYAGDTPAVMRRLRIKSLIKQSLKQLELSRCGIRLETDLSTPLPDILADRLQLSKVLQHLLVNAIDAMPMGGRLNIAARKLSIQRFQERRFTRPGIDYIVITISDSGEGMASQVQSRIFEPFYVGRRKPNHLGLGLSVASGIVKAHGGLIQVNSRQGRGSTFSIFLPCPRKNNSIPGFGRKGSGGPKLHCIHAASACRSKLS